MEGDRITTDLAITQISILIRDFQRTRALILHLVNKAVQAAMGFTRKALSILDLTTLTLYLAITIRVKFYIL